MNFEIVSSEQESTYYQYIIAHPYYTFLQSTDWGRWQENLGRKVIRFLVKENSNIIAAGQAILMTAPFLNCNYLYLPYGPLLQNNLNEEQQKKLTLFIADQLLSIFPDIITVRFEPQQKITPPNLARTTLRSQPKVTSIVNLEKDSTALLSAMHHKTRYNIKVAEKNNVTIISEPIITPGKGLYIKEVIQQLIETAKRQNFNTYSEKYYIDLINFFGLKSEALKLTVYRAIKDKNLLACGVMIDFHKTRTYLFGGSNYSKRQMMAPYLLHWQAMIDAKKLGYTSYDWWGVETSSGKNAGFALFKEKFGGQRREYGEAFDIVTNGLWYNIYNFLRKIKRI